MTGLIGQMAALAWTLASFIVALSIIVGVHEFGHYIVGRWSGIRAETFSIGFGRRLWGRRDRRGTMWQVAAVPLGGYVRFLGDDDVAGAGPSRPVAPALRRQTMEGAPLWARTATVAAGPVSNFILSFFLFAVAVLVQGVVTDRPTVAGMADLPPGLTSALKPGDEITALGGKSVQSWGDIPKAGESLPPALMQDWTVLRDGAPMTLRAPDPLPARIGGVSMRSAAQAAGLKPGDVILSIDGAPVLRFTEMRAHVEAAAGRTLSLHLWRPGQGELDVTLTPREQDLPTAQGYEKRWLIGVTAGSGYVVPAMRPATLAEAAQVGASRSWAVVRDSLSGLWGVVSRQIGGCNISGAISIAEVAGQAASGGFVSFLVLLAVLSAGIGLLNLLPIPMLDGGHLAFYLWEAVTGRPPSCQALRLLMAAGLALVLTLMLFGLSNDILCR